MSPRKPTKISYSQSLTSEDFIRVELWKLNGEIVEFRVQLETLIGNETIVIMGIDNCHGSKPHRHIYRPKNKGETKIPFFGQNLNDTFQEAKKYLKKGYPRIKYTYFKI